MTDRRTQSYVLRLHCEVLPDQKVPCLVLSLSLGCKDLDFEVTARSIPAVEEVEVAQSKLVAVERNLKLIVADIAAGGTEVVAVDLKFEFLM